MRQYDDQNLGGDSMKRSKGERLIQSWLEQNNIEFTTEQTFSWLGQQRCDFYIEKYRTVIEVDGMQHFKKMEKETERQFKYRQYLDKHKNEMLTDHFFQVIRIPYNKLNIITPEFLINMIIHPRYGKVRDLKNLVSLS